MARTSRDGMHEMESTSTKRLAHFIARWTRVSRYLLSVTVISGLLTATSALAQQPPLADFPTTDAPTLDDTLDAYTSSKDYVNDTDINAYPQRQIPALQGGSVEYELSQQFASANSSTCGACGCNCGGECRRGGGCPHPWRTGPGWCDDWCVGPHWEISIEGILMERDNFNVSALETQFAAVAAPVEQFNFEAGSRAYATGRSQQGYDVQLGYVGVDRWRGFATFNLPGGVTRDIEYRTGFHSGELNIYPHISSTWRLFVGVRYFQLNEDFYLRDTPTDAEDSTHVDNKMVGFQIGTRRELWNFTEWAYVEALLNGGIYRNRIKRFERSGTISTGTNLIDRVEFNDVGFVGEAALTAVARLNRCVALRGGYQVLLLDGVTTAQDAFFNPAHMTDSIVYHGAHVGLEYRR